MLLLKASAHSRRFPYRSHHGQLQSDIHDSESLEAAMDYPEFDISQVGHDKLGVSQECWSRYIEMMADIDLIKGARVYKDILGNMNIDAENIRITLKGLEYLTENSIMQKLYRAAKGIKISGAAIPTHRNVSPFPATYPVFSLRPCASVREPGFCPTQRRKSRTAR